MKDLLLILVILLLLLIIISSLGGSISVGRSATNNERFVNNKKPNKNQKNEKNQRSKKREMFSEAIEPVNCVQRKIIGMCDGPCGGGSGEMEIKYETLIPSIGDGAPCLSPSVEPCINEVPCENEEMKAHDMTMEHFDFQAMDESYGLAPF